MKVSKEELDLVLSHLCSMPSGAIEVKDLQNKCPLDPNKIQSALARFETDGFIKNMNAIEESDDYDIILLTTKGKSFASTQSYQEKSSPSVVNNTINVGRDLNGTVIQDTEVGRDFKPINTPLINPTTAEPSKPNKTLLGKLMETISSNIIPTILGIIGAVVAGYILYKMGWI